jgi:hypothetical protein
MQVFSVVMDQMQSFGLPVVAVSLTALPHTNTPVLLMVHWHGFARPQSPRSVPGGARYEPIAGIPGSALQLNDAWLALANLDDAMLQAAWQFGAWDLMREERRGCNTAGASEQEALACRQAFAQHPFHGPQEDFILTEAPDRDELMQLGAQVGYVRWQFRPVKGGVWSRTDSDDTLMSDGGRSLPCPVSARPMVGTEICQTRYTLGHSGHLVLI